MNRPLGILLAISGCLAPASAIASDGEKAVSVSASYGAVGDVADGAVLGITHDRGIGEVLFLHLSGGGGAFFGDLDLYGGHATVGFKYLLFDIVKYVPYATLGAGVSVLAGDAIDTEVNPRLELGLGLDVLRSRSFSYGLVARFEVAPPRLAWDQSSLFLVGAKLQWKWGFF